MTFDHRDFDFSDRHEKALAERLGTPDAVILASAVSVHSTMDERSYLLVVPQLDEPMVLGATVHWPSEDRPYVNLYEIAPVSVLTRRRLPKELFRPFEDREEDANYADAARGAQAGSLWRNGTQEDGVCLVRSLETGAEDPVMLTFVAGWEDEHEAWSTEVLGKSSASAFRDWASSTFETTIKHD